MSTKRARTGYQELERASGHASEAIKREDGRILLVSHFDADGICAGAIMFEALSRLGKNFETRFVKQLEEPVLEELSREDHDLFVFTDLGSGQAHLLEKYLSGKRIVIVDHHQPSDGTESNGKGIVHVNPHLVGIDGKDSISGAGVSFLVAMGMCPSIEPLVELALVGATGDTQKRNGAFNGINKVLLERALELGVIEKRTGLRIFGRYTKPIHQAIASCREPVLPGLSGNESRVVQLLSTLGIPLKKEDGEWTTLGDLSPEQEKRLATAIIIETGLRENNGLIGPLYILSRGLEIREFATMLNACGRLGYAMEGLDLCLGRRDSIEEINTEYRRRVANYLEWFQRNEDKWESRDGVLIVYGGDDVHESMIGTLSSILSFSRSERVVIGFANAEEPGMVKVSARCKKDLEDINLGEAVRMAASSVGGEGGGHPLAAGAKIPAGRERDFAEMMVEALSTEARR